MSTRSPFTMVPFELLLSLRMYWLSRCSRIACRRETMESDSTRSFEGSRPIEITRATIGISFFAADVGLMTSLATCVYRPCWNRNRWTQRILTRIPCFVAGS